MLINNRNLGSLPVGGFDLHIMDLGNTRCLGVSAPQRSPTDL
jgi:hypothetical protein